MVGETSIDAPDAAAFLDRATAFANEALWGSLNATVIVDPRSAREPSVAAALDRAIAGLRYGTVSLNHWSAIGYGLGITPWGAFPGPTRQDIQSGTGFVHNPLMFSRVEKTVVRAPSGPGRSRSGSAATGPRSSLPRSSSPSRLTARSAGSRRSSRWRFGADGVPPPGAPSGRLA